MSHTYKLMIKTHTVTGLKYLCITRQIDHGKYSGSGIHWKAHLKKHGRTYTTKVIYQSSDYDTFVNVCEYVSKELDVVKSSEYANSIHETGYKDCSSDLFVDWWDAATDEQKQSVYAKRSHKMLNGSHWADSEKREEVCMKISESSKHKDISAFIAKGNKRMSELVNDKSSEWYKNYTNILSIAHLKRFENMSDADRSLLSERISNARLNTSEESKASRKKKIQAVYATGKHDANFARLSTERLGVGNPMAKIVVYSGVEMSKGDAYKQAVIDGYSKKVFEDMLVNSHEKCYYLHQEAEKVYEVLTCDVCGKSTNKKPSTFMRWHFKNCKGAKI